VTTDETEERPPGPDLAAMRRVVGEGILLAGGTRAILLQIADPAIGRAVAEHSDFGARPLDRLRATMEYIYGITFGSSWEAAQVRSRVNSAHGGVAGAGYDARDPDLQLWVAATLYDTAVAVYERFFGPIPDQTADDVYRQYAALGTALQVLPAAWPADRTAFASYWTAGLANLAVTPRTRSIAKDLLFPRPIALRPFAPLNRLLTAGLLPASLREGYGIPWDGRRRWMFDAVMGSAALVVPRLPRGVRHLPKTYYLRGLRRRIGTPAPTGGPGGPSAPSGPVGPTYRTGGDVV
jgi:uncharacterized protein (DUF2236 family)